MKCPWPAKTAVASLSSHNQASCFDGIGVIQNQYGHIFAECRHFCRFKCNLTRNEAKGPNLILVPSSTLQSYFGRQQLVKIFRLFKQYA